jgi:hypothetical protein
MNYQDRISIEPGKRGRKPCIRSMRITVYGQIFQHIWNIWPLEYPSRKALTTFQI